MAIARDIVSAMVPRTDQLGYLKLHLIDLEAEMLTRLKQTTPNSDTHKTNNANNE